MVGRDETVFQPFPPRPEGGTPSDADRTRFQPMPAPGAAPSAPPAAAVPPTLGSPQCTRIEPGTVLNRMFRVERLLAYDRTGEVFEGINIGSGERVVVRVILPTVTGTAALAEKVHREVQALIGLSHPALTQYRLVAQEPHLGCHYVVTKFVEGTSLVDVIGRRHPTLPELSGIFRRLAEALKEAHDAGVIHRDLSSDTVLLEHGDFAQSRIVDFGVTKEISAEAQTVIGPGFAGKLSYAAPEQLGDFDQNVGPWTDIYSLGLVILALAQGKEPDLAGLPVEALQKRRTGIDTNGAPAPLGPILDKMLAADPKLRFQSMDGVLAALDRVSGGTSPARKRSRALLLGVGAVAGLLLLAVLGALFLRGGKPPPAPPPAVARTVQGPSIASLEARINAVLPTLACSWVSVTAANGPSGVTLAGSGVAGRPEDVEPRLYEAVRSAGAQVASSDFSGVAPIDATFCSMLDELRKIRSDGATHLTSSQSRYEIGLMEQGAYAGQKGAQVIVDLSLEQIPGDFALYAIEKSNTISEIFPSRAAFLAAVPGNDAIEKLPGNDHYRLALDGTPAPGWSGILLVTGSGGFSERLLGDLGSGTGQGAFESAARANGWKAEMVWYKFVDEVPDPVALPVATGSPAADASGTASAPAAMPSQSAQRGR